MGSVLAGQFKAPIGICPRPIVIAMGATATDGPCSNIRRPLVNKSGAHYPHSGRILRNRVRWKLGASISPRWRQRVNRATGAATVPGDLLTCLADRYVLLETNGQDGSDTLLAYRIDDPSDFDVLERAIVENGYYEIPHVWSLRPDRDKRVMAELVASLCQGGPVLELGCSSGGVLEGLALRGIEFAGVDISRMAVERAPAQIRGKIHLGDLLTVDLSPGFDTIFGLDIFEHLNPNRLGAYLARARRLLIDEGLLFANIPGFGDDDVFGEVFPRYIREWDVDATAGRPFHYLHAGHDGYPINGHLIWAESSWWVEQFEAAGLIRRPVIEAALHQKYDDYLRAQSPARRSFYVFSAGECPRADEIAARITAEPSLELMTLRSLRALAMLWRSRPRRPRGRSPDSAPLRP